MSIFIYLATIFWSLFPNLIHVFQGGDDFINKVNATNLVSNGDFKDDTSWFNVGSSFNYTDNTLEVIGLGISTAIRAQQNYDGNLINDYVYSYGSFKVHQNVSFVSFRYSGINQFTVNNPIINQDYFLSSITQITTEITNLFELRTTTETIDNLGLITTWNNVCVYNVSDMIFNGVKNDNGIPFSELTNEQIKTQLDIWITEHGDLSFTITKDNTSDKWFNTGFVDKQAERDFLDYLGYFTWLMTPPILLFITLDLIRRLL